MSESPDLLQRLRRIHQVRAFTDTPVSDAQLAAILEVARRTGSAINRQPWQFLVVDDAADIAWMGEINPSASWFASAPLVILPLVDPASPTPEFDRGRLTERLFTAAAALGLGAGIGGFPPKVRQTVADHFAIPDASSLYNGVAIGTPQSTTGGPSGSGGRKPLAELVHYGRYGRRTRSGDAA